MAERSTEQTRRRVLALITVLVFISGLFTALDFDRTWMALTGAVPFADWPRPLSQGSAVLRMLRGLLCLVLVLQVSPETRLRARDDRLLTAAFVFAVIGDFFLIFREGAPSWFFLAGVGAFLVCHGVLTARHLQGIRDDLGRPGVIPGLVLSGLVVAAGIAAPTWHFREVMKIPLDLVYVGTLGVSLWAAVGTVIRHDPHDYPRLNRWMIAVGLLLFVICDMGLGIAARVVGAEGYTETALWVGLLPDLTYGWALILLALSGFRWEVLLGRER